MVKGLWIFLSIGFFAAAALANNLYWNWACTTFIHEHPEIGFCIHKAGFVSPDVLLMSAAALVISLACIPTLRAPTVASAIAWGALSGALAFALVAAGVEAHIPLPLRIILPGCAVLGCFVALTLRTAFPHRNRTLPLQSL